MADIQLIMDEEGAVAASKRLNIDYVEDPIGDGYKVSFFKKESIKRLCSRDVNICLSQHPTDANRAVLFVGVLGADATWRSVTAELRDNKIECDVKITTISVIRQMLMSDDDSFNKTAVGDEITAPETVLFQILEQGKLSKASDVHVSVHDDETIVEFRIDSILRPTNNRGNARLGDLLGTAIFSILPQRSDTNKSSDDWAKNKKPLDATFTTNSGARWRAANWPSDRGPLIVLREIGNSSGGVLSLKELGFSSLQLAAIKQVINDPRGMLLITGPTSSGKSTTLISIAEYLNDGTRRILTIEDPVERVVKGINQCTIDEVYKDPHNLAKQTLRQDPDVIIFGELRDQELMAAAVRSATTGHFALGTFHTNGGCESVMSLEEELGVSNTRLSSPGFLRAAIYQELVGTVCRHCAIGFDEAAKNMAPYDIERIDLKFGKERERLRFINKSGCSECGGTGILGKTLLAEVIPIDISACRFISKHNIVGWKSHLKSRGWPFIKDHAIDKIKDGTLDIFACENTVGCITDDEADDFDIEALKRIARYEYQ